MFETGNIDWIVAPSLQHGVVAIEKGATGSPWITIANFTFTYIKWIADIFLQENWND